MLYKLGRFALSVVALWLFFLHSVQPVIVTTSPMLNFVIGLFGTLALLVTAHVMLFLVETWWAMILATLAAMASVGGLMFLSLGIMFLIPNVENGHDRGYLPMQKFHCRVL